MFKKIKLFKKLLDLSKELKRISEENDKTIREFKQFLETAGVLYPKLKGLIDEIIELVKDDRDEEV